MNDATLRGRVLRALNAAPDADPVAAAEFVRQSAETSARRVEELERDLAAYRTPARTWDRLGVEGPETEKG